MKMRLYLLLLLAVIVQPLHAGEPGKAAIATAHYMATEAGHEIIEKGGNAFDAAVAVSAVLSVVEQTSSGIGGGGFWLIHRASDGKQVMVDARETAPAAAHRDMYLNEDGSANTDLSRNGPLAAGIPKFEGKRWWLDWGVRAAATTMVATIGLMLALQSLPEPDPESEQTPNPYYD